MMQGMSIHIALEGTLDVQTEVVGLDRGKLGQLGVDVVQVKTGNLLVEDLGQDVDTDGLLARGTELDVLLAEDSILSLEEGDLSKDLVGERAGHDEGRVTSGTSEVNQTTLSQQDDVTAVGHEVTVNLGLDVLDGLGVGLEPGNVNLNVEVTNVADNGVVAHDIEVSTGQDVTATSGGDEDLTLRSSLLHGGDLVTLNSSLEGVDGVNLGDKDVSTHAAEGVGATLTDVTVTGNDTDLTGNHDIGSTLDTVNERLTATVQVVELGLGDRVVNVDSRDGQLVLAEHLVEVVDTGGGLLRETVAALELLGELVVNEGSQVTTVVEDEVELLAILEGLELLLQAPFVLLVGLTLPGEATNVRISLLCENSRIGNLHRDTSSGNGSSSVVLGGEDVAASPGDLSTKSNQGLDENSGLDGCKEVG